MAPNPPQTPAERIAEIKERWPQYGHSAGSGTPPQQDISFLLDWLTAAEQQLAARNVLLLTLADALPEPGLVPSAFDGVEAVRLKLTALRQERDEAQRIIRELMSSVHVGTYQALPSAVESLESRLAARDAEIQRLIQRWRDPGSLLAPRWLDCADQLEAALASPSPADQEQPK